MVAGDLGAAVEHDADYVLGRVEARDVALVGERRGLPLDRLGDPRVGGQDDLPRALHHRLERVIARLEPVVHITDMRCYLIYVLRPKMAGRQCRPHSKPSRTRAAGLMLRAGARPRAAGRRAGRASRSQPAGREPAPEGSARRRARTPARVDGGGASTESTLRHSNGCAATSTPYWAPALAALKGRGRTVMKLASHEVTIAAPAAILWEAPHHHRRPDPVGRPGRHRRAGARRQAALDSPDGSTVVGRFLELVPYRRIVFTYGWEDGRMGVPPESTTVEIESGRARRPDHPPPHPPRPATGDRPGSRARLRSTFLGRLGDAAGEGELIPMRTSARNPRHETLDDSLALVIGAVAVGLAACGQRRLGRRERSGPSSRVVWVGEG